MSATEAPPRQFAKSLPLTSRGLERHISSLFLVSYLLSMPAYCLIRLTGNGTLIAISTVFTAASLFAFSLSHSIEARGLPRSVVMLLVAFVIALTMEYLGSAHDFLFGVYDYTGLLGPKALGVPVIIPIAWFMMLYPAWAVAGLLTQKSAIGNRQLAIPLRVILAALAMTAWDLSLDPRMVADGAWVWQNLPSVNYFRIPLSNFAGWLVTSAMIYAVWAFLERGTSRVERTNLSPHPTPHSTLPVWAYIITWIGEGVANTLFWGGPLVGLCVFVAMGLFGGTALWLLLKRPSPGPAIADEHSAR